MSTTLPLGARICGSCGYTNVGPQPACLHCAAALPQLDPTLPGTVVTASPPPPAPAGACRSCGAALGPTDAFCSACGTSVG